MNQNGLFLRLSFIFLTVQPACKNRCPNDDHTADEGSDTGDFIKDKKSQDNPINRFEPGNDRSGLGSDKGKGLDEQGMGQSGADHP